MRSRDTSAAVARVQSQLQDLLGPEGRFQSVLIASNFAREFARAALRDRHPEFTEAEISQELTLRLYGISKPVSK